MVHGNAWVLPCTDPRVAAYRRQRAEHRAQHRDEWAAGGLAAAWGLATVWLAMALALSRPSLATPAVVGNLAVWMAATGFPWWSRRPGWGPLAGFAVPVLTLVWVASQLARPWLPAANASPTLWGWVNLGLLGAAITSLLLGAAAAGMYLEHERELLHKMPRVFYYRLPPLGDLDRWSYRLTVWGWASLSGSIVTGGLLTVPAGVYWVQTIGGAGMVGVWLAYLAYVILRARGWRGHGSSWLTVAAFVALAADVVGAGGVSHGVAAGAWHAW
jgi:ABC-type uncharacterized transport system permease subunit